MEADDGSPVQRRLVISCLFRLLRMQALQKWELRLIYIYKPFC